MKETRWDQRLELYSPRSAINNIKRTKGDDLSWATTLDENRDGDWWNLGLVRSIPSFLLCLCVVNRRACAQEVVGSGLLAYKDRFWCEEEEEAELCWGGDERVTEEQWRDEEGRCILLTAVRSKILMLLHHTTTHMHRNISVCVVARERARGQGCTSWKEGRELREEVKKQHWSRQTRREKKKIEAPGWGFLECWVES